jgi:hypothetical protein
MINGGLQQTNLAWTQFATSALRVEHDLLVGEGEAVLGLQPITSRSPRLGFVVVPLPRINRDFIGRSVVFPVPPFVLGGSTATTARGTR